MKTAKMKNWSTLSLFVISFRTTGSLSLHCIVGNKGIMKALLISWQLLTLSVFNPPLPDA